MKCALCTRCQAFMISTALGWKSSGRCGLGGPFTGYVQADPDDAAPAPRYGPLVTMPRLPSIISEACAVLPGVRQSQA